MQFLTTDSLILYLYSTGCACMTKAVFWLVFLLGGFFFTVLTNAQEPENTKDSIFLTFDTLRIKFPKVYWFNSHKFQIEGYAHGKSKQKVHTTSHKNKKGIDEAVSRHKFIITIVTLEGDSALIEGEYIKRETYITHHGTLLENLIGIESETTELLSMTQQKTATITTSIQNDETWEIVFLDTTSPENLIELPSLLRSNSRTIQVGPSSGNQSLLELGIFNHRQYTFLENDKVIGKLNMDEGHLILLQKTMDPRTRLVIISAIMFICG